MNKKNKAYRTEKVSDYFKPDRFISVVPFLHLRAVDLHRHEFFEIGLICGGSGSHQIGETHFKASRGCVAVIPPGQVHGYSGCNQLQSINIRIVQECFERVLRATPNDLGDRFSIHERVFTSELSEDQMNLVIAQIEKLSECIDEDCQMYSETYSNEAEQQLARVLDLILEARCAVRG